MSTNLVAPNEILSLIDIFARKEVNSGLNFGDAKNRSEYSSTIYKFIGPNMGEASYRSFLVVWVGVCFILNQSAQKNWVVWKVIY